MDGIELHTRVNASTDVVWRCLTDADARRAWWPEAALDARLGGRYQEPAERREGESPTTGMVVEHVRQQSFVVSLRHSGDAAALRLRFQLTPVARQTDLELREDGYELLPPARRERLLATRREWLQVRLRELEQRATELALGARGTSV